MAKFLLVVVILALCISCGLFSPREVQFPSGLPQDRLALSSIAPEKFTKTQYADLIAGDCFFKDRNLRTYDAAALLERLNSIEQFYETISIRWSLDTTHVPIVDDSTETIHRKYTIWLIQDTTSLRGDFRGRVSFKLREVARLNTWEIFEWHDTPLDESLRELALSRRSFFNPEFVDGSQP